MKKVQLNQLKIITRLLVGVIILNTFIGFKVNVKASTIKLKINDISITSLASNESLINRQETSKPLNEHDTINLYIQEVCSKYNIDPYLIMSIIQQESKYNPNAKNGNCLGLMQLSSYWHTDRAIKLGVTNFYDPYSNILLGVDYISELLNHYKDISLVLMLYSMDNSTAFRMYSHGQISNYVKTVLSRAEDYRKGE